MARYVKTGRFDPWQVLNDEAEQIAAAQRRARREVDASPLRLTERSTEEETEAYRRDVREREEALAERVAEIMAEGTTEFDRWCAEVMFSLFNEAWWLGETHQFRDGRPLGEQNEWRVGLLGMIRAGITERQWGGGGEKSNDGDGAGGQTYRDMPPEELEAWLGKQV